MRKTSFIRGIGLFVAAGLASTEAKSAVTPLTRFPNSNGKDIVFSARGHLWGIGIAGGRATAITHGDGYEFAPRYSPDGKWIAFTGNRGGVQDVYVLPAAGGVPRRLTTLPAAPLNNGVRRTNSEGLVVAWTPDSSAVVFLSRRLAWNGLYRPTMVSLADGAVTPLPVDRSGYLSFGPDGHSFAFTRTFTEFKTWKRYDGGQAEDVEVYDPTTRKITRITGWKGLDGTPMWVGRRIYFVSDRDSRRRANLWVHDLDTGKDRQLTHFVDFDIDLPSYGGGLISFQQGGRLWTFDVASGRLRAVDLTVPDDGERVRPRTVAVKDLIREQDTGYATEYALSPTGDLAAFSARGDIFLVAALNGAARDITATSNADEDHPAFSPDGHNIAYTSDGSGENQLMVRPVDNGRARQLTHFSSGYLYMPVWSPDGRWIVIPDGTHRLWLVAVDGSQQPKAVAEDREHFMHETDQQDAAFSADGRWLAYSVARPTRMRELHLYEIVTGRDTTLSAPDESDYRAAFSADGRYLYFVSDRHEVSVQSDRETAAVQVKSQGIYVTALAAGTPPRFGPTGISVAGAATPGEFPPFKVDLAGLMQRAVPVPVEASHLVSLEARAGGIFYTTQAPDTLNGSLPGEAAALHWLDPATGQDVIVAEGLDSHALSADGRRVLYRAGGDWMTAATEPGHAPPTKLLLDEMQSRIDPRQEWKEMFENAWRLERDLFVNPNMNGNDWTAVHDTYARLLPKVASRDDLNFLIGELIGELSSSHTYVGGGDYGQAQAGIGPRFLGADYQLDATSGRYRIAKIYTGDNTRSAYRSPLAWPGLDVQEGDYLTAIDGRPLSALNTPDALLADKGKTVSLSVARTSDGPVHDVIVTTASSETALRRLGWERNEQALTEQLSGGRVGYVHIADMQNLGMEGFVHQFYGQLGKEALLIDERFNGGGNTDQIILERLRRVLSSMQTLRGRAPQTQPDQIQVGPKAMLINHFAGSDGDVFPYHFRAYGLGPLVGTRPWGGVRGIEWFWPLLDGGYVTVPQITFYDTKGDWILENHGVEPDVQIEDRPWEVVTGGDVQLETAVALLMRKLPPEPGRPLAAPTTSNYPPEGEVTPASVGVSASQR
ncbi:S41 family peptidase [Sphingomonas sp. PAMC 26621]|uniref:S41 family peptidase n=1 Tax=Sphingomonas sp. PAMC 26621 TaxID=1112213 RepID=UPI00028A0FB7|nr:S41 family peptidase [Sphingomonas sp. PAMC 26621]